MKSFNRPGISALSLLCLLVSTYGFLFSKPLIQANAQRNKVHLKDGLTTNQQQLDSGFPRAPRTCSTQLLASKADQDSTRLDPTPLIIVGGDAVSSERDAIVEAYAKSTGKVVEKWSGAELPPADVDKIYVASTASASFSACPTAINIRLHPSIKDGAGEDTAAMEATRYDLMVAPHHYEVGRFAGAAAGARELARLAALGAAPRPSPREVELRLGKDTFFLSLTYKDIQDALPLLDTISEGSDALEFRADILASHQEADVMAQLRLLRDHSALPVIFTVRSRDQCGTFPDDPAAIFPLLKAGLRAGLDVLDFEACWPRHHRDELLDLAAARYPSTLVMPSYHVVGRATTEERAKELFLETYHGGRVDAVKVVLTAVDPDDSWRVHAWAQGLGLPVPYIALCLGEKGQLSRVLNRRFTPVTHRALPFVAAPGQLAAAEIMRFRRQLGIVPKRKFFLLGTPISASPSPDMHNSGFRKCDLPHEYGLLETEDIEDFAAAIAEPDFGGASVTIPHKQNVQPYMDAIGPAAEAIGAINTVVVSFDEATGERRLTGENTDWLGITRVISRLLRGRPRPAGGAGPAALVVGGGGTAMAAAYAMQQMGCRLAVYNRTPEKAEAIAGKFGGRALAGLGPGDLEEVFGPAGVDVIVSTIPAAAEFTLPDFFFASKPAVLDAAYKPPKTALLAQAMDAGCPYAQGAEMLIEQGIEQFQFWTERLAPAEVLREAVYNKVEKI